MNKIPVSFSLPAYQKLSFFRTFFASFLAIFLFFGITYAQDSTKIIGIEAPAVKPVLSLSPNGLYKIYPYNRKRITLVAAGNIIGYAAILTGLNAAWYVNYPRSSFHTFNDNAEWLQVDKTGHMYGSYIEGRSSMELWRWTGVSRNKRIWLGGLSGAVYQTIIETLDGFSAEYGWSWGDFGANILGSGILISQELAWDDQRIKVKFSFHRNNYHDPVLDKRADFIYGKTEAERFIKDYNAQTYWLSADLKSFFPESNLPRWLCVSVGYGAEGMFGARGNYATDKLGNVTFDRRDINRYRQWYLAPDIDLTKIRTNKKALKTMFTILSAFKFPTPSLELSQGNLKWNWFHF